MNLHLGHRPKIINVMATSIDGYIASRSDEPDSLRRQAGFSNDADCQWVENWLMQAGAVIIGASSLRAAGGFWLPSSKPSGRKIPKSKDKKIYYYIFSKKGFDENHFVMRDKNVNKIICSPNPEPGNFPSRSDLSWLKIEIGKEAEAVITDLEKRQIDTTVLFGGGQINRIFYSQGCVNELALTIAPFIIGNAEAPRLIDPGESIPMSLKLLSRKIIGSHQFLHYAVQNQKV